MFLTNQFGTKEVISIMEDVVEEFNTAINDILVLDSVANTLHGKVCT